MSNNVRPPIPDFGAAQDLTHAPQHIRDARREPVPMRPYEVKARVQVTIRQSCVYPNGRLWVARLAADDHAGKGQIGEKEMVAIKALDFRGVETISQILISLDDLPTLLQGLVAMYRLTGATQEDVNALCAPKESTRHVR